MFSQVITREITNSKGDSGYYEKVHVLKSDKNIKQ
jgi:hypothetical protein